MKPKDLDIYFDGWIGPCMVEINCLKCSAGDVAEDPEASKEFYDSGWRVTPTMCYCPECAKKYLTAKKHNLK